jgi:hypothetical protein
MPVNVLFLLQKAFFENRRLKNPIGRRLTRRTKTIFRRAA